MLQPLYHISYATPDGQRTDESELKRDLGEVIEVALSVLHDSMSTLAAIGDREEAREINVQDQVRFWAENGWDGETELVMPNGSHFYVKQVERIDAPDITAELHQEALDDDDAEIQAPDTYSGFEQFDSLLAQALSDIAWVRDDLASWESNPESARYDSDKLRVALRLIVNRLDHYTKER